MNEKPISQIALIGFGEFGGIFATDLAAAGLRVSVFDILLDSEPSRTAMLAKAKAAKVSARDGLEEAICDADLVISAVTCSAAVDVARNAAPFLRTGQTYLDIWAARSAARKVHCPERLTPETRAGMCSTLHDPCSPIRVRRRISHSQMAAHTS